MDYITVDYNRKEFIVPEVYRTAGVKGDNATRTLPFKVKAVVDGDYEIRNGFIKVAWVNAISEYGAYNVSDYTYDGENLIFEFPLSSSLTKEAGTIMVGLTCFTSAREWSVAPVKLFIGDGINDPSFEGVFQESAAYDLIYQMYDELREIHSGMSGEFQRSKSELEIAVDGADTAREELVAKTAEGRAVLAGIKGSGVPLYSLEDYISNEYLSKRNGKKYQVKVWKCASNPTPDCIKLGDNEGLVCEPSTDTTEGRDDYADIPFFQWQYCNYEWKNYRKVPVALEGAPTYSESGSANVGTVRMNPFYKFEEHEDHWILTISDSPFDGCEWFVESEDEYGRPMPYLVFDAYPLVVAEDGKSRSQPHRDIDNFTSCQTSWAKGIAANPGIGHGGDYVNAWLYMLLMVKYATKSSSDVFAGVTSYNFQYTPAVKSSVAGNTFTLTSAQANNVVIGGPVTVGYPNASASIDRGVAEIRAYGIGKVVSKEASGSNVIVTIDEVEPFTTTDHANGSIYLSSWPYYTGSTQNVIGHHDGSITSNTNGKYPCRIDGIEIFHGAYEIVNDFVAVSDGTQGWGIYKRPRDVAYASVNATNIRNGWKFVTKITQPDQGTADLYVGDLIVVNGSLLPVNLSPTTTSTQGAKDRYYHGGAAANSTTCRVRLALGNLRSGSYAGFGCLSLGASLSSALWNCAARG